MVADCGKLSFIYFGLATGSKINVWIVKETDDPNYSLSKVLIKDFIKMLLPKIVIGPNTIIIIVTAKGVSVQDICSGKCFQHDFIGNYYLIF